MSEQKLTAKNMKSILWETLQNLKDGKVQPAEADAIAQQSREIVRVVKCQQDIIRHAKKDITEELIDYAIEQ